MHDFRKRFEQWVRDAAQKRRVRIEVGEGLRLELKALATEVIVDKVEHSAFSGVGRVDLCKRSQDRLLIRVRGFVDENFRVGPELSKVNSLQQLVDYSIYARQYRDKARKNSVAYCSGAEYLAWTPWLHWRQWYLRRQRSCKGGRWTGYGCRWRDRR